MERQFKVEVGDEVKTLHLKRAIYGTVMSIGTGRWRGRAFVTGAHYPSGPEKRCVANVEDLEIIEKGSENK